jgi:hypothetical protein
MPTSAGPNSKGENSLVFAFDMADTQNSNLGEPTENLFLNPTFIGDDRTFTISQNWTWSGYTGQSGWRFYNKTNSPAPLKFPNEQAVITTGANNDGTTQNRRFYCNVVLEPNTTYTVSVWMYYDGPDNMSNAIAHFEYDYSGNGLPLNSGYFKSFATFIQENNISRGEWFRFQDTYTTGAGYEGGLIGPVISGNKNNLIAMQRFQIEKKPHVTPFVNGERTFYNSIKDLTKRTSIGANFVNFNSEGKILFDGTGTNNNLYVDQNNDDHLKLYGDHTIEAVVNPYSDGWVDSNASIIRFGMGGDLLYAFQVANRNQLLYHWYDTAFRSVYSPNGIVNENQYNHVLVVKSGLTVTFYSNGVYSGEYAITQSTVDPGRIGIGATRYASVAGTTGQDFSGEIPVLKIYNKALSAEEVSANFEVIRKRFNI